MITKGKDKGGRGWGYEWMPFERRWNERMMDFITEPSMYYKNSPHHHHIPTTPLPPPTPTPTPNTENKNTIKKLRQQHNKEGHHSLCHSSSPFRFLLQPEKARDVGWARPRVAPPITSTSRSSRARGRHRLHSGNWLTDRLTDWAWKRRRQDSVLDWLIDWLNKKAVHAELDGELTNRQIEWLTDGHRGRGRSI